jgi:Tfp pilus assembly protein FimV
MAAVTIPQGWGAPAPRRAATTSQPDRRAVAASVYRRRRLVVLLLVVLAVASIVGMARAAAGLLGGGPLTAAEDGRVAVVELDAQPVARATYVVRSGDTLWSIARRIQPDGDVRPLVDALAATRDGRALQPGERIVVP